MRKFCLLFSVVILFSTLVISLTPAPKTCPSQCDWERCSSCLCQEEEGDCDLDNECKGNLVCCANAGKEYGCNSEVDICLSKQKCNALKYETTITTSISTTTTISSTCAASNCYWKCCSKGSPCRQGEGDCDSDSECKSGLICKENVGAKYGCPSSFDVCEIGKTTTTSIITSRCDASKCDWTCCSKSNPCGKDEGDCDSDSECKSGLICKEDIGNQYGCHSSFDVCEVRPGVTSSTTSSITTSSTVLTTTTPKRFEKGRLNITSYIVELETDPVLERKHLLEVKTGGEISQSEIEEYRQGISLQHERVKAKFPEEVSITGEYTDVFNGFAVSGDLDKLSKVLRFEEVEAIYPDLPVHITLDKSVPLIKADEVWKMKDSQNRNVTGKGIKVAVIDTGVDYTHPDLGGCERWDLSGKVESYDLESKHYKDNYTHTWTIKKPGFSKIAVHFETVDVHEEENVTILNSSNNVVKRFSGEGHRDYWSKSLPGNTLKIKIETRPVSISYGFKIDKVLNGKASLKWPQNCSKVIGGYDFLNEDKDPIDDQGHGTHVAGTIAGTGKASTGKYKGVAPNVKILAYKAFSRNGKGKESDTISAMERAINKSADVISMSFGSGGSSRSPLSKAANNVVESGTSAVAAAGNAGPNNFTVGAPGVAEKVITVGASTHHKGSKTSGGPDKLAWYSSRGPTPFEGSKPDILAPGGDVFEGADYSSGKRYEDGVVAAFSEHVRKSDLCVLPSPSPKCSNNCCDDLYTAGKRYIAISGTSMATPHVSGVVALMKQKHPNWSPEEIKATLEGTAKDLGYSEIESGTGRVNAKRAVGVKSPYPIARLKYSKVYPRQEIFKIKGTASGRNFKNYSLYYGSGRSPSKWVKISSSNTSVVDGKLGVLNTSKPNSDYFSIELRVGDNKGRVSEDRVYLYKRMDVWKQGWPRLVKHHPKPLYLYTTPFMADLNKDGLKEIITLSMNTLYVFNPKGSIKWKKALFGGIPFGYTTPAVGNVDEDEELEIAAVSTLGLESVRGISFTYLFDSNGTVMQGWPKASEKPKEMWSGIQETQPVLTDINNDGKDEIITFGYSGDKPDIRAYDFKGNVSWSNSFEKIGAAHLRDIMIESSPGVGDINNDNEKEVIHLVGTETGPCYIRIINSKGKDVTKNFLGDYRVNCSKGLSPVLGEIDDVPGEDIVVSEIIYPEIKLRVTIINYKGKEKQIEVNFKAFPYIPETLLLGDIDNDKKHEMVFSTGNETHAYNYDGSEVKGFPIKLPHPPDSITLTDIDGDSTADLIISETEGHWCGNKLYAYTTQGKKLNDFPMEILRNRGNCTTGVVSDIGDPDKDGDVDLIVFSEDEKASFLNVIDLKYPFTNITPWPTFHHDIKNTNSAPRLQPITTTTSTTSSSTTSTTISQGVAHLSCWPSKVGIGGLITCKWENLGWWWTCNEEMDFGDGTVKHKRKASHRYQSPGTYEVKAKVCNWFFGCQKKNCKSDKESVRILGTTTTTTSSTISSTSSSSTMTSTSTTSTVPSKAHISCSPSKAQVNEKVTCKWENLGWACTCKGEMDFGDGTVEDMKKKRKTSHKYKSPGTYKVESKLCNLNWCFFCQPNNCKKDETTVTISGGTTTSTTTTSSISTTSTSITTSTSTSFTSSTIKTTSTTTSSTSTTSTTSTTTSTTSTVPGKPHISCSPDPAGTGEKVTCKWKDLGWWCTCKEKIEFGDGKTVNKRKASHKYQSPGTYKVKAKLCNKNWCMFCQPNNCKKDETSVKVG